ncbi:MAG: amidohydrolase family protein [Woeseiaceae bacterium]|nr:amidohydrolase family protein [Woeseiaceae bacterium]
MKNIHTLALLTLAMLGACTPEQASDTYDVLIVNGTVYDGTLNEPRVTNIGIRGDRIASMEASADAAADIVIDAGGLAVMPGFIDPHTHAEEDFLLDEFKSNINYLAQGVTTVFVGNDGDGFVDLDDALATMRHQGIGTNVAFFTGHETARRKIIGLEDRAPTAEELEQMRAHVEREMRAGALGLSTGLFYAPGSYADTAEVIELAKVASEYGGVYDSHLRDESSYTIGLLGAIREAIEIGEQADIPVHIAHLKALGRDVWGQSGDVIALVAAARERGLDVTADQYPYRASGSSLKSSLVPRWVEADSEEAMLERLANADLKDRIRAEMEQNLYRRGGADSLLVTEESEWRGKTLAQIAEEMGVDPIDAAIEVVRGGNPSVASFNMNPDDIDALAMQPWVMTGSDGSEGHPRKFATYPQAYQDMVVAKNLFPVTRFVHRSSGLVADFFKLCDRGYLRNGMKADIAIIDLENFQPRADFNNPTELATGVDGLLVNGQPVIVAGEYNDRLAGEIIHRQQLACPR